MKNRIQILDCTLRDGSYIVNSKFGTSTIKGIIKKMQDANIDLIECGWLKNTPHEEGSAYYHVPADLEQYLSKKSKHALYLAMIDWDRYDLDTLPEYDGKSIDAIRVVFPCAKFREGIALGQVVRDKGYKVFFQAANTLEYTDEQLIELADEINKAKPEGLSIVDTFGAMYQDDLKHIVTILDKHIDPSVKLGFHSHNNQQLSFSLTIQFMEMFRDSQRRIILDSSLCGMGRGAGNTTTELLTSYVVRKFQGNYDLNIVMDAIDMYMGEFQKNFQWGYSTPYFISGLYCAHVNNIAYLLDNHRCNAKDMRNVIESLPPADRRKYDYDLLEQKFVDYQNKVVDDEHDIAALHDNLAGKEVLLICPGKSATTEEEKIKAFVAQNKPVVIGVNAVNPSYKYDYLFFSNTTRYDYACLIHSEAMSGAKIIVTSNIKTEAGDNEYVVNFNLLVKRGWEHFDNSAVMCLRLLNKLRVDDVKIAGLDGFTEEFAENYSDTLLPPIVPGKTWNELNEEIKDMLADFMESTADDMTIKFLTPSKYE